MYYETRGGSILADLLHKFCLFFLYYETFLTFFGPKIWVFLGQDKAKIQTISPAAGLKHPKP